MWSYSCVLGYWNRARRRSLGKRGCSCGFLWSQRPEAEVCRPSGLPFSHVPCTVPGRDVAGAGQTPLQAGLPLRLAFPSPALRQPLPPQPTSTDRAAGRTLLRAPPSALTTCTPTWRCTRSSRSGSSSSSCSRSSGTQGRAGWPATRGQRRGRAGAVPLTEAAQLCGSGAGLKNSRGQAWGLPRGRLGDRLGVR